METPNNNYHNEDEKETRRRIDAKLREVGWEADSENIRFSKGARPQKGINRAIAEWPTASGPADYVLFVGLTPLAVVEAKRHIVDIPGMISQSRRYSRDFKKIGCEEMPAQAWGEYKIPFVFATNGRDYLRQIKERSGIWFHDIREETNHPRPLESWYTPEGLESLLKLNVGKATRELEKSPLNFPGLRPYQEKAIKKIESEIAEGTREILVAMATGTGKTRTCLTLMYRLVKAKRFNRILFLVDREWLGEQAGNAFKEVKLENLQSFADIYDLKELGEIKPDKETRAHFATVQGLQSLLLRASAPR